MTRSPPSRPSLCDPRSLTMIREMPAFPLISFDLPLEEVDPEVAQSLDAELSRQRDTLEMIASRTSCRELCCSARAAC